MSNQRIIRLSGTSLAIIGIFGIHLARNGFFDGSDGGLAVVLAAPVGIFILIVMRPRKDKKKP